MIRFKEILGFVRAPFLLLPPVCVALGAATAHHDGYRLDGLLVVLALIGAVAAHIAVNAFNEYADFRSGLDATTTRTPFSGGSGTLPHNPAASGWALGVAIGCVVVVLALAAYFALLRGPRILPLALAGLVLVVSYSFWLVRRPLLCLLAPGVGFGTLMVIGTHLVLTGQYSTTAALMSMVPMFLVSNLLLLNQFPDVNADRVVGRKTLPIVAGLKVSALTYALFSLASSVTVVAAVAGGVVPPLALLALVPAPMSVMIIAAAFKHRDTIPALVPAMGMNVVVNLVTPLLLALGLVWG